MKGMIKKLMVVLVSAFLFMGTVFTPVEAKGSNTSGANGWNPWGWFWGWGYPQPTQPTPAPTEEPVVEEETEEPEIEEEEEETPVIEEEPVIVEEPVVEEEPEFAAQEFDAVSYTEGYSATISFEEDAQIADGATASIEEYEEGTDEFAAAKEAVLASKGVDEEEIGFIAFDMTLYDAEGNEIEPEGGLVNVALSVPLPEEALNAEEIEIHHIDSVTGEAIQVAATEDIAVVDETANADLTVDGFSTFTITWRNGGRTVTVHYVDESGNELTIANPANTHPDLTQDSTSPAFLIYDIEGYEYYYTYRNTNTNANRIAPLLTKVWNGNYFSGHYEWRYMGANSTTTTELSNNDNIYVVYRKKADPTMGGTVQPSTDETWPEEEDELPTMTKKSINAGNGTNTITLTISAAEKAIEEASKANVIVIFDVSGSMSSGLGSTTRLAAAKTAVNSLADTLLGKNSNRPENDPLVKMALISFSTTAQTVQDFTSKADVYKSVVNGLNADGGTNWEQALSLANHMTVDSDAATFVVFVTDGDPTFRISRGDVTNNNLDMYTATTYTYYRRLAVFGTGNSDNQSRNFDYAVKQVTDINANNKQFYAIGVSNEVTKVQNLVTQGGVDAGHAYLATQTEELNKAFDEIAQSISSALGFGDIEITDGITELTNLDMKVMSTVDENSFRYYRYGGGSDGTKYGADEARKTEWLTREQDGCAAASYNTETGSVEWNMGEGFQLEDGVTYVLEFSVWPSQYAYDLVADLDNGIKVFEPGYENSITDEERAQVVEVKKPTETEKGQYALKTNTNTVGAKYNKTSKTGDVVTIEDETDIDATYLPGELDDMALTATPIQIQKDEDWENVIDKRFAQDVLMTVTKDNSPYIKDIDLNVDNHYTSGDEYISCGVITQDADGYKVKELGHEYTVTEPEALSYLWEMEADVYRPMVINGQLTLLIKTEDVSGLVDGVDYYTIDNKYYLKSDSTNTVITAKNRRRSVAELVKKVDGSVPEGTRFSYTITVQFPADCPETSVWFSANTTPEAEDPTYGVIEGTGIVAEENDQGPTGYYYANLDANKRATFTIGIEKDWVVRFINLLSTTKIDITEDLDEDTYDLTSIAFSPEDSGAATINKDEANILVNIAEANTIYRSTFTNKPKYFYIYHSTDNTVERISVSDDRIDENGKFNIVNEIKTDNLYGGYFMSYSGTTSTDAEIISGTYEENGTESAGVYNPDQTVKTTGFWMTDAKGSPYNGSNATAWKLKVKNSEGKYVSNVYTEKGTEMTPVAGTVYYLKEIPDQYFRPALYYVYDTRSEGKELKKLYLMVPTDDSIYDQVSSVDNQPVGATTKLYSTYKVTAFDGTETKYNANTANSHLPRGYLTVWDVNSLIKADQTYVWTPTFITKDGVTVTSVVKRTIVMGNTGFVDGVSNQANTEEQATDGFYVYDTKPGSSAE